jgi:siroheme synthase (precorrin-2 oxidase/ferrochelatase)
MSLLTRGQLVLGISTGGDAPAVAATLRRWLEEHLSPGWAMAAQVLGETRRALPSGHARMNLLKNLVRDAGFLGCVERNDEKGLRGLIADAVHRMPV